MTAQNTATIKAITTTCGEETSLRDVLYHDEPLYRTPEEVIEAHWRRHYSPNAVGGDDYEMMALSAAPKTDCSVDVITFLIRSNSIRVAAIWSSP